MFDSAGPNKNNVRPSEAVQDVYGRKPAKTEGCGAKLDASAQFFYTTGSNKNNVNPKEALQDVH